MRIFLIVYLLTEVIDNLKKKNKKEKNMNATGLQININYSQRAIYSAIFLSIQ